MTPETLVIVVVMLLVKYTLEFADRTGPLWRRRRPGQRRRRQSNNSSD